MFCRGAEFFAGVFQFVDVFGDDFTGAYSTDAVAVFVEWWRDDG